MHENIYTQPILVKNTHVHKSLNNISPRHAYQTKQYLSCKKVWGSNKPTGEIS